MPVLSRHNPRIKSAMADSEEAARLVFQGDLHGAISRLAGSNLQLMRVLIDPNEDGQWWNKAGLTDAEADQYRRDSEAERARQDAK